MWARLYVAVTYMTALPNSVMLNFGGRYKQWTGNGMDYWNDIFLVFAHFCLV